MSDHITFVTGKTGPPGPTGTTGPTGPTGAAGSPNPFTHTQSTAAATWTIIHNYNRLVQVELLDDTNKVVYADVDQSSLNQVVITFPAPTTGKAFLT